MTREEKIKGLYNLKGYLMKNQIELNGYKSLPITLIDYAIEALEQEPCDDVVSRQAVLDIVCGDYKKDGWGESNFYKAINDLPSVRPKEQTGHWIETEYHRWRCSVCREKGMSEWDNIHNVRTNFCSECGAEMVEPQESENP